MLGETEISATCHVTYGVTCVVVYVLSFARCSAKVVIAIGIAIVVI